MPFFDEFDENLLDKHFIPVQNNFADKFVSNQYINVVRLKSIDHDVEFLELYNTKHGARSDPVMVEYERKELLK